MIIALTLFLTSLAALSGIYAIGSGRHWAFDIADYFRGKRNAVLYLWVVCSAIFSILHSGAIFTYGITWHWVVQDRQTEIWMAIHATIGILLTLAHLYVAKRLSLEADTNDSYLWGPHSQNVPG